MWRKGPDSYKADPPNATISIFDESGNKDAVVEISNPVLLKETITFTADILQGSIPASFSAGTLFIDYQTYSAHNALSQSLPGEEY